MLKALVVEDNRTVANLEAELLSSVGVSPEIRYRLVGLIFCLRREFPSCQTKAESQA